MDKTKYTIQDVARIANVSVATVSRVINNIPKVKPKTRQKVLQVVKQLNYIPNLVAKSLKKKKTENIGLFVPMTEQFLSQYYFKEIVRGISEIIFSTNYELNIKQPRNFDPIYGFPSDISLDSFDGLILIAPPKDDRLVKHLEKFKTKPVVLINFYSSELSFVDLDNIKAAKEITEYLISLGYRRILFIGGPQNNWNSQHRLEGYKLALAEHNIPYDPELVYYADFNQQKAYSFMKEFLDTKKLVDAVFCANDLMAIGVICAIKEKNLKVPDDISVVGFDDIDIARYYEPPLTTVRQPFFEMGKKATEILLAQIENKTNEENFIFQGEIVIRKSTSTSIDSRLVEVRK